MTRSSEGAGPKATLEDKDNVSGAGTPGDLLMAPEQMLDLAQRAAELLVERIDGLSEEKAWDGDFQQALEDQLAGDPPENGRLAQEVLEQAAKVVLPFAARLDHARFFGFIPSSPTWPGVLADFMAAGYNINACTWLVASGPGALELVVIDWLRRRFRLSRQRGRAVHERRLGGEPRCLRRGPRSGGPSRARDRVHE